MTTSKQPSIQSSKLRKPTAKRVSQKKANETKKFTLKTALSIIALPIWVCIAFYVSQYAVVLPLYHLLGKETLSTPVWLTVANALVYLLTLCVTIFVPIKIFSIWKTSREELGLKGLPTWADLGLAPVGFIAYFVLAMVITAAFAYLCPWFDISETQETGFDMLTTGVDRLVAFLALVVFPPIAEEILFRGWLYGKLRAKIPGKVSLFLSILITSILFGLVHNQWNVGVNVFAMSVVLCVLREITGTIYSGILLHMLKNGVAFFLLYIVQFGF